MSVPTGRSQTERHEEAMRLWRVLENLDESERKSRLEDEGSDFYQHPASAMLATLVFKRLGIHNEDREIFWEKLAFRPVGNVWKFYQAARERKPEEFAGLISSFAKRVSAMKDEAT